MDVDDPGEFGPFLVAVENIGQVDVETTNASAHLRGCQEKCNQLQNLGITLRSIIESGGIDEGHRSPVDVELIRNLDLSCARLQVHSDL